jgi:hypothetical protein
MLVDLKTILKIVFYFIAFSNIKYAQIANTISDTIKHQLNQVTVTGWDMKITFLKFLMRFQ